MIRLKDKSINGVISASPEKNGLPKNGNSCSDCPRVNRNSHEAKASHFNLILGLA